MKVFNAGAINDSLEYSGLVDDLHQAFAGNITVPKRQHYDIPGAEGNRETTLLMMPAWQDGQYIGVKLVTVAPENATIGLPSIQGQYLLFDAKDGQVCAMMDAPALTAKRTAAASALASRFLSRQDSQTLFMVGTGTLAPELIQAHASVRPIRRVLIWGRNKQNCQKVIDSLDSLDVQWQIVEEIEQGMAQADIISVATLSQTSLVSGKHLLAGQHLDLVGAYRPDMREADDDCLLRSKIFVDNRATATIETGDLKIPLEQGVINQEDVLGDLFDLCRNKAIFERAPEDITLFKSVGHALEDLAAAKRVFAND